MTDRHNLPSHLITSQAHWDAMADILGETETEKLYGTRPELYNSAESVERLYSPTGWRDGLQTKSQPVFNDKAPKRALWVAVGLAVVLAVWVPYKATHRREAPVSIDPCALVLTRESGPECR